MSDAEASEIGATKAWRVRAGDVPYEQRKEQLQYLIKKYDRICQLCFKEVPTGQATREHIVRLIDGGTSDMSNLTLACMKCNFKANDQHTREMMPALRLRACIERQKAGLPVVAIAAARTRGQNVADTWPILIEKGIRGAIRRQQLGVQLVSGPPPGPHFSSLRRRREVRFM